MKLAYDKHGLPSAQNDAAEDMLQQLATDRAGWERRFERETKPVNMKYLVFFKLNDNPDIEIRSIRAGDTAKAETFVVNAYGNRLTAEDDNDLQRVDVLHVAEEPEDWNVLHLVNLNAITYSLDSNYHLTVVDSRLLTQNFTWL